MQIDPAAVAAVGHRIGSSADDLRAAHTETTAARFGPDAAGPEFTAYGTFYARGIGDLRAAIAALDASVIALTDGFDSAAAILAELDASVATTIERAGPGR